MADAIAKAIAAKYGITASEVLHGAVFAEAVDKIGLSDPSLKEAILDGNSGLTTDQVILKAEVEYTP